MGTPVSVSGAPLATTASSAAALEELSARVEKIAAFVDTLQPIADLVAQAPALAAIVGDSFDDLVRQARAAGIDVERGVLNGASAALRFGALMDAGKVREIDALLNSGVLDPPAVQLVGDVGRALTQTASAPQKPLGIVGVLRALGDPDVQRALGFIIGVARRFGARLPQP